MIHYDLAPLPQTQALSCPTFRVPPLDRTLPEIYEWHLENTPDHTLFVYGDENNIVHKIKWPKAVTSVQAAARILRERLGVIGDGTPSGTPVIAVLAASDTITYFTVMVGCLRAGYACFPISTRNSPNAIAHLLKKTHAAHLLVGREDALSGLAEASLYLLEKDGVSKPNTSLMPVFEDMYNAEQSDFEPLDYVRPEHDTPAVILHSSGSTAFPKPVTWTHFRLMQLMTVPFFGEVDLAGKSLACHGLPMYHGLAMMQTGWTATSGLIMATFKPQQPAMLPTPDAVIKGAIVTNSDIILCVPAFIEYWFHNPDYVNHFKEIHGLLYGGGPLNEEVGDGLTAKGINIFILYGCTEIGIATPIIPKATGKGWGYFPFSPQARGKFIPNGDPEGHAELVILKSKFQTPCVFNGKLDGEDAYFTGDLLTPHPTKPNLWKIYARSDDILVHNSGEKTNPSPIESALTQDPKVQSVVMFGHGKFNAGVLVDPKPEAKFDPQDAQKLAAFRNAIWPTVERANASAPQHSRIFKEMILVASPLKPFTYTAKATPRRLAIIKEYSDEIDTLYAAVEETTQSSIPRPESWSFEATLVYVRKIVHQVLGKGIGDEVDLFENGCDSLQATWIRNTLLRAVRDSTKKETRSLPNLLVYQYPTTSSLSSYIVDLTMSDGLVNGTSDPVQEMIAMASKYSQNFRTHSGTALSFGTVALITGTTGGLGASLLHAFVNCEDVKKIYALNRPDLSRRSIRDRHQVAFTRQDLNLDVLKNSKVTFLEAEIDSDGFSVAFEVYEEMRRSVTHIVHNAWRVDFNVSLRSFESNIKGVRNLVDFAISSPQTSPPSITFISSIGVVTGLSSMSAKEGLVPAESACGQGYTESKWCSEQILDSASSQTSLRSSIVRVGQVVGGGGGNGYWNIKEWFPLLVKSSKYLGKIPSASQSVSWVPMDLVVKSLRELTFTELPAGASSIFHIAHPRPVLWDVIAKPIADVLNLSVISNSDWLKALRDVLERSHSDESLLKKCPAIQIFEFFENAAKATSAEIAGKEAMGLPLMSLAKTKMVSPTLGDFKIRELGPKDAEKWIGYWKSECFI